MQRGYRGIADSGDVHVQEMRGRPIVYSAALKLEAASRSSDVPSSGTVLMIDRNHDN